ncbi:hypothetical protein F5Y16DRAFT_366305 [Xylariaceae sp. FL0255]|nr:hypothetical protein F5Y16DRAFT_366305 [Xylariaceae sp. FL0255]
MATRFLILSDSHDDAFPIKAPAADVILHCGDMTMIGGLSNYRRALDNLKAMDAELKLVIAGNHDVSLDLEWWEKNLDADDDIDEPSEARNIFLQENKNGIHLLDRGLHEFTLETAKNLPSTPPHIHLSLTATRFHIRRKKIYSTAERMASRAI